MSDGVVEILSATAFRAIDVGALLDPGHPTWVKFDPELGYVPSDIVMRDGVDFSWTTYTHEPDGARRMVNHRDQPCRINTYGDSFTQCQQVSDDETWQERLAAHFGEPIRNFGSGGYGVNQAVMRAMRMEETESDAEYVLLNIFDDDHIRNLDAARWIRTLWAEKERPPDKAYPLHGLPWAHLRYDLDKGAWVELPGLCANEGDLRALCDADRFRETFKDDVIVRLFAMEQGFDADPAPFEMLAEALHIDVNLRDPATRAAEAMRFHRAYGFKSSEHLLQRFRGWLEGRHKKLIILLSYSVGSLGGYLAGDSRFDDVFVDWLATNDFPVVDIMERHAEDYRAFNLSIPDYIARYYVGAAGAAVFGHYTPTGNHFYAFAIKDDLRNLLEPRPPAYRD